MTAPNPNAFGLAVCIVLFLLFMAGCSPTPPEVQTRLVEIPSSKPYRYIHYSDKTDEATARQIRRHNRAHSQVINAEKEAQAKAEKR
jgi:hypothetical protein